MEAPEGVGMQFVPPYGECDEGALCLPAVQVALATDRMRTPQDPTRVMVPDCFADDCRWPMGMVKKRTQCASVSIGQEAMI